ncbi:hypothetical protein LY01_02819 [Nonlabens xylanidelens]|uniref:Lipoprotein n=1 Tax=Nonlabens xylanidelens TaxID=191564 RepID=A0A2S6IET5_9FLAO|nr:hypothetical protein [Nonlabens xylanidelens]PPK92734.1 hypothetical protein LY01_02819 [Nonlabens xylanidelens]PQJ19781.1 hypothetical protein BST94_05930 [Nonlabens xylanidelens]
MKKVLIILCIALFTSCNTTPSDSQNDTQDPIKSSETYKLYVQAYNNYAACKQERPQLTKDFMDKKITQEEFSTALESNGKLCNIKKEIYNKYYQLLEAEFDKAAEAYEITE